MPRSTVVYSRDLPGGGYVAVDVRDVAGDTDTGGPAHRARLWIERRGDPTRRFGHTPPVIVERVCVDPARVVAELRAIAADNVALAQAMRRWAAARPPPTGRA